jgi:hypothetical protein
LQSFSVQTADLESFLQRQEREWKAIGWHVTHCGGHLLGPSANSHAHSIILRYVQEKKSTEFILGAIEEHKTASISADYVWENIAEYIRTGKPLFDSPLFLPDFLDMIQRRIAEEYRQEQQAKKAAELKRREREKVEQQAKRRKQILSQFAEAGIELPLAEGAG